MKYIRTKAGEIYDIDDLYVCEELNGKPYGVKGSGWVIYQESIIKQADTIEELCDEFVVIFDRPCVIGLKLPKKSRVRFMKESKPNAVYAAIWTDKGLIYVAKLNDKGKLELL